VYGMCICVHMSCVWYVCMCAYVMCMCISVHMWCVWYVCMHVHMSCVWYVYMRAYVVCVHICVHISCVCVYECVCRCTQSAWPAQTGAKNLKMQHFGAQRRVWSLKCPSVNTVCRSPPFPCVCIMQLQVCGHLLFVEIEKCHHT